MKKILPRSAFLTIALLASLACQSALTSSTDNGNKAKNTANVAPKADEHGHTDDAPRITLAEAKKDFDAGNVIFIDTRAKSTYDTEHIKGAINMTTNDVEARYKEIPTGKKIIAYCS